MDRVYRKSPSFVNIGSAFCPGCLHGVAYKLIAETLDKFDLREKTIGILPVGCATLAMDYNNYDMIIAAHGRAPAIATGFKRTSPDQFVYAYQGDGDLASIGIAEAIHCANRGENITTIFVNNSTFGMTGGQMAPTSLTGQQTTTCPGGRNPSTTGFPIRMAELIAGLEAPVYVVRCALNNPKNIIQAKKAIEKAVILQMEKRGYSFIELLSNCPTNWRVTPEDSLLWMEKNTLPYFPLGTFKTPEKDNVYGK